MIPVSAKKLRHRPCELCDSFVKSVRLFPLFDRHGRVRHVMVLPDDAGTICLAPWRPGQWHVPLWGPIRFDGDRHAWRDLARYPLPDVALLWHYDPWWVLDEEAYTRHRDRSRLKETNCPDHLEVKVPALYFRRDLSCISLALSVKKGSAQLRGWSKDWLPASRAAVEEDLVSVVGPPAKRRWVLDPVWTPLVKKPTRSALRRRQIAS